VPPDIRLRLKCTKFTFCWGSAPDPAGGAYSAPRPLPTSKGIEGNGRGEEKVKGKEGERWREGFGPPKNFGVAPPMGRHSLAIAINNI